MPPVLDSLHTPRYDKIPAHSYKQLPERPNLEHLKAQAKTLLRQFQAGDPKASRRVRRFLSENVSSKALRLKDAQHVIACEYAQGGWKFQSWQDLKTHVDAVTQLTDRSIVESIERMTSRNSAPSPLNPFRFLSALGVRIIPHLNRAIKAHPDAEVRCGCLNLLYHMNAPPDDSYINVVVGALIDRVPKVRRFALQGLNWRRGKTAASLLKPEHLQLLVRVALCDKNARIRAGANSMVMRIMGTTGDAAVKSALKQFALSSSEQIRERAQCLLQS